MEGKFVRSSFIYLMLLLTGCAATRDRLAQISPKENALETRTDLASHDPVDLSSDEDSAIQLTGLEESAQQEEKDSSNVPTEAPLESEEETTADLPEAIPPMPAELAEGETLVLDAVISSVYQSYPMLEAALYSRNIASGERLSAAGAWDVKLKAASENGPTGFYQTYRQSVGVIQPLFSGGEVFAGYRIGRGDFEPWYQERETNKSGEFKVGANLPLVQNRAIDERRATIWRADYGRQLVEPDIHAQLIGFVQEASYAYWEWVAAGARYRIAERVLKLAEDRTDRIKNQVEQGFLDPPEETDNLRLVSERKAKLAEFEQKLNKAAIKLSLYYRNYQGQPVVPGIQAVPDFPQPRLVDDEDLAIDAQLALGQRPEIALLNLYQRQLDVDYAQARNQLLPALDAVVSASQDTGTPTSKKNDKGEFELDASLFFEVPLQRRKALGKLRSIEGKVSQLNAKRRLTENKIVADVQIAYAALTAFYEQVIQAQAAVKYAEDLAERERLNQKLGASDMLKVTLREQYAAESALKAVDALSLYFEAQADYRAALAQDRLP